MTTIKLMLYRQPAQVEVFVTLIAANGNRNRQVAIVDTGAPYTLAPLRLLTELGMRTESYPQITLQQAGIGRFQFDAWEVPMGLRLEDRGGNAVTLDRVPVWFADT